MAVPEDGLAHNALGGQIGGLFEFRSSVLDPAIADLGRIATGLLERPYGREWIAPPVRDENAAASGCVTFAA